MDPLDITFYRRPTLEVARDLLGRSLCRRLNEHTWRGRIVEVEAYDGPTDRASHAHRGRTRRNAPMFEAGGIAYVYQIYGVHFCFNVVTGEHGWPSAILIRATEPPQPGRNASGPGRLCGAFGIDRALDGASLVGGALWLEAGSPVHERETRRTARIGVDSAGPWARRRLRWIVRDHPAVSGPRLLR